MTDQILLDNYLMILKSSVEVYVHGTLESSNENIRELLKLGLDETINHQAKTYTKMTEYGFYSNENVDKKAINKTYNSLKKN